MERDSAKVWGDSDFGGFKWSVDETVFTSEAAITTIGTDTDKPVVTFYVTVGNVTADTDCSVKATPVTP